MQNKLRALRRSGWLCVLVLLWSQLSRGQVTFSESFDNTTFPPSGWTNHHTNGTGTTQNWARLTSQGSNGGYSSTITPHSGAAMADFNAWNYYYPSASALATFKFNLANRGTAADTVWFWVYRHSLYTGSYHDSMVVYINTTDTIGGATKLGCIHGNINYSPTESTTGWHKYGFALPSGFTGSSNYILFDGVSTYGPDMLLDDVSWTAYPPGCTGVPAAGTSISSPSYFCGNSYINLVDTGYSNSSGLIYRWGYSYDNVHWIDVPADSNPGAVSFFADTTTYYWLTVKCKASGDSSFSSYAYATQSQRPKWATLPYSQDFESWQSTSCVGGTYTNDQPDSSWFQNNTAGGTYGGNYSWRRNDQGSTAGWNNTSYGNSPTGGTHSTGTYSARLHTYNGYTNPAGINSNIDLYMMLGSGQKKITYDLNDYYYGYGYTTFKVLISSDGGKTFTTADTHGDGTSGWTTYSVYTYATGKVIIRFNVVNTYTYCYNDVFLDNVNVSGPCSGPPTAGTGIATPSSYCGNASIALTLTGNSTTPGIKYQWQDSSATTGGAWVNLAGDTAAASGASGKNGTAYYRCKLTCATTNDSTFSSAALSTQNSTAKYATLPYYQDFESWTTSACVSGAYTKDLPDTAWNQMYYNGHYSWRRDDQGSSAGWTSGTSGAYSPTHTTGSHSARFHAYNTSGSATVGPIGALDLNVNLSTAGTKKISFDQYSYYYYYDSLYVLISADAGATFTKLGAYGSSSYGVWASNVLYTSVTSPTAILRFQVKGNYIYQYYDFGVDNLSIVAPCSGPPTTGTATVTPTSFCANTNVTLKATGGSTAPGVSYQWQDSSSATGGAWVNLAGDTFNTTPGFANMTTYYRSRLTCHTTGDSAFTNTVLATQTQAAKYAMLPYFQGFENWATSSCAGTHTKDIPDTAWGQVARSGDESWRRDDQGTSNGGWSGSYATLSPTHTQGSHSAMFNGYNYNGTINSNDGLDLFVDMSAAGTKQLTFDFNNYYYGYGYSSFNVLLSTDGGAHFTTIGTYGDYNNGWTSEKLNITSTSATTVIRFMVATTYTYMYNAAGLDNVNISLPCSGPPTAGTVSTVPTSFCANSSIALSLNSYSNAPGVSLQWQDSSSTTGGAWVNINGDSAALGNTYFASNTIYFRNRVTCRNTGDSTFTPAKMVTQTQAAKYASLPYFQDFEAWSNSACAGTGYSKDIPDTAWGQVNRNGNESWRSDDQGSTAGWGSNYGSISPTHTHGSHAAFVNSYNSSYTFDSKNGLDLYANMGSTGSKQLTFDFNNYYYGYGYSSLDIQVSTNGGQTFSTVASYGDAVSGWQSKVVNISSTSATTVIRFHITSTYGYIYDQIAIDNVHINLPCSGPPTAGTAAATPTSFCGNGTIALTLNGGTSGPGISYQWQDSTSLTGGAWANLTDTFASGNNGLMMASGKIRCKTTCRNTGNSSFSSAVTVTQTQAVKYASLPYSQGFENWQSSSCVGTGYSKDVPDTAWSQISRNGNESWRRDDQGSTAGWSTNYGTFSPVSTEGSHAAVFNGYNSTYTINGNDGMDLYVNMSAAGTKQLTFNFNNYYYGYGYSTFNVLLSKDGGATWSTLGSYGDATSGWQSIKLNVVSTSATTVIRFQTTPTYTYMYNSTALDNVAIALPCSGPSAAGTASVTPSSFCDNASIGLNLGGYYNGPGISLQWQDSSAATGGAWVKINGDSAAHGNSAFASANTYFRSRVVCRNTHDTTYSVKALATQTSKPKYVALPYSQSFENWSTSACVTGTFTKDQPDSSWNQNNSSGNYSWRRDDQGSTAGWSYSYGSISPISTAGSHSAVFNGYNSCYCNVSNGVAQMDLYINCSGAGQKQLTFDYWNYYYGSTYAYLNVYVSKDGGATFSALGSYGGSSTNAWQTNNSILFNDTSSHTVLRFEAQTLYTYMYNNMALDNIVVVPACSGTPSAGTISPSSTVLCSPIASVLLAPTGVTQGPGMSYKWQKQVGTSWVNITGATSYTYTVSGPLSATTSYRLYDSCSYSHLANTSNTVTVSPASTKFATLPYSQSFESWTTSACATGTYTNDIPDSSWSQTASSGNQSWRRNDQGSKAGWSYDYGTFSPNSTVGSYSAHYNGYNSTFTQNSNNSLDLYFNAGGAGNKNISFDFYNYYYGYGYSSFDVYLSKDGGATFTNIGTYGDGNSGWTSETINVNDTSSHSVLRFKINVNYGYMYNDAAVDNVKIIGPCTSKPTAGTATASSTSVCPGATASFVTTGATVAPGVTYQWRKSSTAGGPYSNATGTGATTTSYTTGSISSSAYYHMNAVCTTTGQFDSTADIYVIAAATPSVTTSKGDTICGPGVDSLFATGASTNFHWYTASTGGALVGYGSPYTPTVAHTTTYYVANYTGSTHAEVGPTSKSTAGGYTYSGLNGVYNQHFDALVDMFLDSIDVPISSYSSGAYIKAILRDNSGNGLDTITYNVNSYATATLSMHWFVPTGTGYYLDLSSSSGVYFYYNYGTFAYPFSAAGICNITGAWYGNSSNYGSSYNFFTYNMKVSSYCESTRKKVVATVKTPPTVTLTSTPSISGTALNLCSGDSSTITPSSSASPAYTYSWKDGSGNSVSTTGGVLKVKTASNIMYLLTANNGLCNAVDTVKVVIHGKPVFDTLTASPRPTCAGNPVHLNAHALPAAGSSSYCTPPANLYGNLMNFTGVNLGAINDAGYSALTSPYYHYYSNEYASLSKSGTYDLYITTGGTYYTAYQAWIDYNGDGVFDASESLGTSFISSGTADINFTVPSTASTGTTRMRIRSNYGYYGAPSTGCSQDQYGETRDYNVVIGGGITYSWSPSTGLNNSTIGKPTATVSSTVAYAVTASDAYGCSTTATDSVIIQALTGGMAVTTPKSSCGSGGSVALTLSGNTQGGTIQWQSSSSASGPFTNISGATKVPDTVTVASKTYYRAYLTCGSGNTTSAADSAVILTPPSAPTITSDTVCGAGNIHMTASLAGASGYNWYDSATGGNLIATGASITTPYINQSTTYYVAAYDNLGTTGNFNVGPTGLSYSYTTGGYGTKFNVTSPVILDSVDFQPYYYGAYPYGQGTITGTITTGSGATVATISQPYSGLAYGGRVRVAINTALPVGNNYVLTLSGAGGYTGYYYGSFAYPYTNGGISITQSTYTTSSNYYMGAFNWLATGQNLCSATTRTAVTAVVKGIPTVKLTSSTNQVCPSSSNSVTLTTTVTGSLGTPTYAYYGPGVTNTNASSTTATVSGNSIYRVRVTASGCSNEDFTRVFYPYIAKNNDTTVCVNNNSVQMNAQYFGLPSSSSTCGGYIMQKVAYNHDTLTNGHVLSADSFYYYGSNQPMYGWYTANLGFNFNYFCNNYSTVNVSPQGYIYLGTNYNYYTYGYPPAIPNYSGQKDFIALAQSSFTHSKTGSNFGAGPGGLIRTQTFGTSPNRKCVIEWKGVPGNYYPSTDFLSGQIVLYENTGAIELNLDTIASSYYVTSGIEDSTGGVAKAVPGRNQTYYVHTGRQSYIFTPTPSVTYSWTPSASVSSSTVNNPTATPTVTTTYKVSANNGACSVSDSVHVHVNPLPTAAFSSSNMILTCAGTTGLSVNFTGTGPWVFYYTDSVTTYGPVSATTNPYTLNVSQNPGKRVKYTLLSVRDNTGCTPGTIVSPASQAVYHIIPSGGTISPSTSTICAGNQLFTLNGAVGSTVTWRYDLNQNAVNNTWTSFGTNADTATLHSVNRTVYVRALVQTAGCSDYYSTDGILKVDTTIYLTVTGITSSSATATWTPQLGATSYIVHWGTHYKTVTGTTTTLDSLSYCTSYNAYVTPNYSACGFGNSNTVTFTSGNITLPLTLTAGTGTSITASWSGGTAPYKLYYAYQTSLPTWTAVTGITTTSYKIASTQNNKTLLVYVVDAGSSCSSKPQSRIVSQNTVNTSICATSAPSSLTIVPTAGTAPMSWSGSSSYGYEVYYKKLSASSWTAYSTSSTTYTLSSLSAATTYVAFVANRCSSGVGYSSPMDTFTTEPLCNHPINLALSSATCHGFTATWNAIAGATQYAIYFSYTTGGGTTVTWNYRSSVTSYTITTLAKSTLYSVYVKTINCTGSNGLSIASATQSISTLTTGCKDDGNNAPAVITSASATAKLNVFPNPNKGYFTVDLVTPNTTDVGYIQVYNLTGQVMYEEAVANNNGNLHTDLDLTNKVAAGVYFLRVKVGTAFYTTRIVTQR